MANENVSINGLNEMLADAEMIQKILQKYDKLSAPDGVTEDVEDLMWGVVDNVETSTDEIDMMIGAIKQILQEVE